MYFSNEYICLNFKELIPDIRVILETHDSAFDVTDSHLLLGYKPLLIGIPKNGSHITSHTASLKFFTSEKLCGTIRLCISDTFHENLTIFVGHSASHELLTVSQQILHILIRNRKRKNDPLNPPRDLYDQIRVAYSYPRKISVITVGENELYNVFPTDLHGEIHGQNKYIISLRENGKAFRQVVHSGRICLSTVSCDQFREVYALGKNHMQDLQPVNYFPAETLRILNGSGLAVYGAATGYLILKMESEQKAGIHHLITFSIEKRSATDKQLNILSHIHSYYALWRKRNNFSDILFIR
jgi:hypothetical protein